MIKAITAISLLLAASPALANYGEVEIQAARSDAVTIVPMLAQPAHVVVAEGTCQLSQEHLVSIPESFTQDQPVQMACLAE